MRRKKKSRLAAAEFLTVLIVTAVVFTKDLSAALAWRGYKAVGGEFMLLLLPIIYYEANALQNVGGDSSRKRRAITHTFIIIALSGTVCKGKKSSAKRVFTGSYGILTNRP